MPGRHVAARRGVLADPKYGNQILARSMNHVMGSGKKTIVERIVCGALGKVKERDKAGPLETFEKTLDAIAPLVEMKSHRIDDAACQAPVEVRPSRRNTLAICWLVDFTRRCDGRSMAPRLTGELPDAAEGKDAAIREHEGVHCMAEANRAFPHYRF